MNHIRKDGSNMSIVNLKYDYQKEMYTEIKEYLDSGETSLCYVLCMGLGKSYIFLKILEDYFIGKRVLYIAPKHAIAASLKEKSEFKSLQNLISIDFATFASFNKPKPDYLEYDGIFIDECHHCNSRIQGKNLMDVEIQRRELPGKMTIGFSATPIFRNHYSKDPVDIRKMFKRAVNGISIADAIRNGILPKIKYAVAIPDLNTMADAANMSSTYIRKKYSVDSTKPMLQSIVQENSEIRHWIAFFTSKDEMKRNIDSLRKFFPTYTIYEMYTGMEDNQRDILNQFDDDPGYAILVSISMLLEGVHPKTCGGVMLYRNSNELVFVQVLGRLMDIDNDGNQPIFVDVVNAIRRLDLRQMLEYETIDPVITQTRHSETSNSNSSRISDIIDTKCSSYRYVQMLEDIVSMNGSRKKGTVVFRGKTITFSCWKDLSVKLGRGESYVGNLIKRGKTIDEIVRELENNDALTEKRLVVDGVEYVYTSLGSLSNLLNIDWATANKLRMQGSSDEDIIRWAIRKNTKKTIQVGDKVIHYSTVQELATYLDKPPAWVYYRVSKGQSIQDIAEEAILGKQITYKHKVMINGEPFWFNAYSELDRKLNVHSGFTSTNVRAGYSYDDIVRIAQPVRDQYKHNIIVCDTTYAFNFDCELDRQLGKYTGYTSEHKSRGKSYERIIRQALGIYSFENHIEVDGKSFDFNTSADLDKLLGKYSGYVAENLRNGNTYEDIIRKGLIPKNSGSVTVGNITIEYDSIADLSRKLGMSTSYVPGRLKRGETIQQIAENVLLTKK